MTILKIEIDQLKRISAMRIEPDGQPCALSGDNGAGKSSVIDAIVWALTGEELVDPIRHGAAKGEARLTIGNPGEPILRIERTATRKGDYLKVYDAEDRPVASPQKFIDTLIRGRLALDPMEFLRMKPKEQAAALRQSLGLVGQTQLIDEKRKALFDERTDVNREHERAKAKLQPFDEELAEAEMESAADLLADLTAKETTLRQRADLQRAVDRDAQALEELKRQHAAIEAQMEAGQELLDKSVPITQEQVDEARRKVADNDNRNRDIRHAKDMAAIAREAFASEEHAGKLTRQIEACDHEKAALLADVKMPYPGLEITEDGVYIEGETLEQKSTGEQIKISCMIAMANKPDLRLLIIREGALVNEKNRALIYSIAAGRNWQVWEERFSEKPLKDTLHIVAGKIEQPEE